jgi:hypothetical protein
VEPVSPELVLISPELRRDAPYGPLVPRPACVVPLGAGVPVTAGRTFGLPALLVAVVVAAARTVFQASVVIACAAVVVAVLFLLAR